MWKKFFLWLRKRCTGLRRTKLFDLIEWGVNHKVLTATIATASMALSMYLTSVQYSILIAQNAEFRKTAWNVGRENLKLKAQNDFLMSVTETRYSPIRMFPYPAWESKKTGDNWRILYVNPVFERVFEKTRWSMTGFTYGQIFGQLGEGYEEKNDSAVKYWKAYTDIEMSPDSVDGYLYSTVWPYLDKDSDTLIRGFSLSMPRLAGIIDSTRNYEVIKIVSDTLPDAIGDTILRK